MRFIVGLFQGGYLLYLRQDNKEKKDKYVQMCKLEQKKMNTFWPCVTAFFAGDKKKSRDVRMDES
jgi:hypothetical protein